MTDLLIGLEEWQLALAAFLLTGSFGLVLSRTTWTKGNFWAVTRHIVAQKGTMGLVQSLFIPLVLDLLASPRYLQKSVGLKKKPIKELPPEIEDLDGPRDLRDLVNPDFEDRIESLNLVSNGDGKFAIIKVQIEEGDEAWTL